MLIVLFLNQASFKRYWECHQIMQFNEGADTSWCCRSATFVRVGGGGVVVAPFMLVQ